MRNEQYYELILSRTANKLKCQLYPGDADSAEEGAVLTIKPDINHGDYPVQVLQKDVNIPAIRECPTSYSIQQTSALSPTITPGRPTKLFCMQTVPFSSETKLFSMPKRASHIRDRRQIGSARSLHPNTPKPRGRGGRGCRG